MKLKKLKFFTLLLLFAVIINGYSQENPKIDKKGVFSHASASKDVSKTLKNGEAYYADGIYDAALSQYLRLYTFWDTHSPLNYKIGVCCLNGVNPKNALDYLVKTSPSVATDYYYQLGRAYLYNNRYAEAKESFNTYLNSLKKGKKKKMTGKINQLLAVCDFSEKAYRDSLPVFIINMGPNVNSYYDDYSPVEYFFNNNPQLYFTSRRPKHDVSTPTSSDEFKERIFYSSIKDKDEMLSGEAYPASIIKSRRNISISGANNKMGQLFYYEGKKNSGDIYAVTVKPSGKIKDKRLKNKVNKISRNETCITFAENGDCYFISDRRGGVGGKDIWYVKKTGENKYDSPVNMGKDINTPFDEEGVYVTEDGNTLYFSSNGHPGMGGFDVYKVEKENGHWGKPVNMGYPINSPDDDIFYRPTSNPNIAYYSTKRQGSFGGLDLFMIKKDLRIPFLLKGNVTDIASGVNLNATVTLFDVLTTLPVGSAQNDSVKGLYSINMEDIGSYYLQADAPGYRSVIEPFVNPTARHEVVEKNFQLERLARPFTLKGYITDVKTGKPVQAEIIMKPENEENPIYRAVSDINSGFYSLTLPDKINMDLRVSATNYYSREDKFELDKMPGKEAERNYTLQKSVITYTLSGFVKEEETGIPVKSIINAFVRGGDGKIVQAAASNGETGAYEIQFTGVGPFDLQLTAEGYFFANETVMFVDETEIQRNFELKKIKTGVKIVIENILFNTGNATLKPESFTELNKLVNLLKENPKIRIEISGHTDNVGAAATNKKLSKARAMSVMNYLISQGISADRVEYEGYGMDFPIAPNTTAEGRAANRRVEMKILD